MSNDHEHVPAEPRIWAVAGCLFEVSLARKDEQRWRWAGGTDGVTLLAEQVRASRHHFRFRAEEAGARAGTVRLTFQQAGHEEASPLRHISVPVAPEDLP